MIEKDGVICSMCAAKSSLKSAEEPASQNLLESYDDNGWLCPQCTHVNLKESRKCSMCESSKPETYPLLSPANNKYGYDQTEYSSSIATRSRELNTLVNAKLSQNGLHAMPDMASYNPCLSSMTPLTFQINTSASNRMPRLFPNNPYFSNGTQPAAIFNSDITNRISIETSQGLPLSVISSTAEPLLTWQKDSTLSRDIQTAVANSLREGNDTFPCSYILKNGNLFIPAEVRSLPKPIQAKFFSAVCDVSAQKELEKRAINWWLNDITPTSRIITLLNRANGDCLLDSLMQAAVKVRILEVRYHEFDAYRRTSSKGNGQPHWLGLATKEDGRIWASFGVVDSNSFLRQTLASTFLSCQQILYQIWFEHEKQEADAAGYELSENQVLKEWESCLKVATSRNEPLEQIHIFILANIFRRPIVVYSVKSVSSVADDLPLAYSNFQGLYLPFLWEKSECSKVPLVVGYTPSHFSALVPITPLTTVVSSVPSQSSVGDDFIYLPLFDVESFPMPVHFSESVFTSALYSGVATEDVIRDWMVISTTPKDQLWVKVSHTPRNDLTDALFREWMNAYLNNDATTSTRPASPDKLSFEGIDVPFSADKVTNVEPPPPL
ncbi:hypothetical protein ACTXT7_009126 [Hymenolepis weldensis]